MKSAVLFYQGQSLTKWCLFYDIIMHREIFNPGYTSFRSIHPKKEVFVIVLLIWVYTGDKKDLGKYYNAQGPQPSTHSAAPFKLFGEEIHKHTRRHTHISITNVCTPLCAHRYQDVTEGPVMYLHKCIIFLPMKVLGYGRHHPPFVAEGFSSCCLLSDFADSDSFIFGSAGPLGLPSSTGNNSELRPSWKCWHADGPFGRTFWI